MLFSVIFTDLFLLFFRFNSVLIADNSVPILQILRCPGMTPEICHLKTARIAWNPPEYKIQNTKLLSQTIIIIMYILLHYCILLIQTGRGRGKGGREGR